MLNDPFLTQLQGIDWDLLSAQQAIDLRAALIAAVKKSDEWFARLTQGFSGAKAPVVATPAPATPQPVRTVPARVAPSPPAAPKRGRGRPRKRRPTPAPLKVGGADAEGKPGPKPAQLFENSYVSTSGPRPDVPYSVPANHPRFQDPNGRPTSVTPEIDAADFEQAERLGESGVRQFFNPRG